MQLAMDARAGSAYKSRSQIARVVTEGWAAANLYCVACPGDSLTCAPCNTKAHDFHCGSCGAFYQLKSREKWSDTRVADAGYSAMMASIAAERTPNLFVLHYSPDWHVKNLLLVPSFFFTPSAIEKRKPLAPTARRAGWIGCNILLSQISPDGKIEVVSHGAERQKACVRENYARVRPFALLDSRIRGWALDVLTLIRSMSQRRFALKDVYRFEASLSRLHPGNQHVRPKIRQQLQVLRDMGLLNFVERGVYEVTNWETQNDAGISQNHSGKTN